ncbi:MAG: carboxypeptidase regulatory-like domain-containing protein [Bryobacterales bacterium]|nr:carboxypeptidase regulatory-like domain-containing protein [Bryobacterales bacterium]
MIVVLAIAALGIADLRFQPSFYGPRHPLLLFQDTAILLWTFALAAASASAFRSLRTAPVAVCDYPNTQSVFVRGFLLTALLAVTLSLSGYARQPAVDRDTCVATSDSGCLHGTVLDTSGHPLRGVRVQALPVAGTGDARSLATKSDWTDNQGRYQITGVDPGRYLIAVHDYDAPHQHQPFPTTCYPGVAAEDLAARLRVVAHSPTLLDPLRLWRLPTATVTARVRWADGTPPQKSNLLLHNVHYPNQAVIGDVAPQIHDGLGEVTLPVGYTYSAGASVTCDAGSMIVQRQSPPVRHVPLVDRPFPSALTFTIPGARCTLWSPPQDPRQPFPTLAKLLTGLFTRP